MLDSGSTLRYARNDVNRWLVFEVLGFEFGVGSSIFNSLA